MDRLGGQKLQSFTTSDEKFMQAALEQARLALNEGEVPVGCVVVQDDTIIGMGRNKTNETRNGTRHAEMVATDDILAHSNGSFSFSNCQLYVTCEPCIMCAAALSLLGFKSVVYGCANDKFGGNGSIVSVHQRGCGRCGHTASSPQSQSGQGLLGSTYPSQGGLYAHEAITMLQDFYIAGNPNAPKPHRPLRTVP